MIDIEQLIIDKLASKYGATVKFYYAEDIPSNLKRPCFIIGSVREEMEMELGSGAWHTATANVVYLQDTYNRADLKQKKNDLLVLLQNIGGSEGQNVNIVMVDESLSATARYDFYTNTVTPTADVNMATMTKTVNIER